MVLLSEEKIQENIVNRVYGDNFEFNENFTGPLSASKRFCSDKLCLFVFFFWIVLWIVIGSIAMSRGTPLKLIAPYNSDSKQCGVDSGFEKDKYLMYFEFTQCVEKDGTPSCNTPTVCVESCPSTLFIADNDLLNNYTQAICKPNVTLKSQDDLADRVNNNECARWYFPTKSISRRCVILDIAAIERNISDEESGGIGWKEWEDVKYGSHIAQAIAQAKSVQETVFDELGKDWSYLIVGFLIAMAFCMIYLLIILWFPWMFVWISIFAVISLLAWCGYDFWANYQIVRKSSEKFDIIEGIHSVSSLKSTYMIFFIISIIVLVIVLLILLSSRNVLPMVVALIAESSRAVANMKSTLLFPICLGVLQVGIIAWSVAVWMNLVSAIEPVFQTTGYNGSCNCTDEKFNNNGTRCEPQGFSDICQNCVLCVFERFEERSYATSFHNINVMGFIFFSCFISAFCDTTLAGTFATWYWTFNKSDVPFFTLGQSVRRTLRYNIGTLALGAVVILLLYPFKIVFESIESVLGKCSKSSSKCTLCCTFCCSCCFCELTKIVNSNLYIMCAIHGNDYSYSALAAYFLIMRNILRVSELNKVTDFLFFLGKLSVTSAMVILSIHVFKNKIDLDNDDEIPQFTYYLLPVMIVGIGSYFIASIFFSVYAMAVDTLFLCFLEDLERNDGSLGRPYFMSKNLMRILGKRSKKDEERLNIIYI